MRTTYWFAALVALSFLAGCAGEPSKDKDSSLDAALARAKAENKVVVADFYTDWCHWCKVLDEKTWKDPKVEAWLKDKVVFIKLDAEKEVQAAKRYYVRSYPQIAFIKPDGSLLGKIEGFKPPEEFLKEAETILAGKPTS